MSSKVKAKHSKKLAERSKWQQETSGQNFHRVQIANSVERSTFDPTLRDSSPLWGEKTPVYEK